MKLCLISLGALPCHVAGSGSHPGGSETQTSLLADALAARGHEVSMVVTDYDAAARSRPRTTSIPLHNAFATRAGVPGLRFFAPRWIGLHRAMAEADADAYFQMCAGPLTGQVAFFCGRRNRGFVFATASDTDVDPSRFRLNARDRLVYRWGLERADRIVTQHAAQQAELRRTMGLDSTVIGMSARIPERHAKPDEPPIVLWVANYRAVKRPELFLETARRFPDTPFHMVGGATGAEPNLHDRVRAEAATVPNVVFHGHVPDPSPFYERAWVLLNTSSVEGFPTTFLEAWGRGAPTVSFFDPGGLIAENRCGVLASTPKELHAGLARLLASREERDALGARGRAYVLREHDAGVVTERFERELLLAARAHGRGAAGP